MKQNMEHGEKKFATRSISFILALVFVFSIFSGMVAAEEVPEACELVDFEGGLDSAFIPSTAPISFAEALIVEVIYEKPQFPNPFGHSAIRIGDKVYDVNKNKKTGKWGIRERNWTDVKGKDVDRRGEETERVPLTKEQANQLKDSLEKEYNKHDEFDFNFITNNCADWVEDKLREVGVNLPDNLIQFPKSTLGQVPKCNPIIQFELEKTENLDLSPPAVPENCVISGVSTDLKPSYTHEYDSGWYSVGEYTSKRDYYYWEEGVVEASGTEKYKCSHTGVWEDKGTITWSGTYQKKYTKTTTVSYPCAGWSSVKLKVLLAEPFFNSQTDGRNGENPPKDIYINISSCIFPSDIDTHNITVNSNVSSVVFFVYWWNNESDVDLTLNTPSGIVDPSVASADPSIDYRENTFFEYYGIQSPEPGNWTINITAVSVPSEGLNYTIIVNLVSEIIVEVPAEFNDTYSEYGTDTDGDGLYDYLTIDVGVDVITPGNYSLIGWLQDANGNNIESAINHTHLDIGSQTVKLNFNGKKIHKHGVDGPYHLKRLTLSSESSELVDYIFDAYTTNSYNYTEFQTKLAEFTGSYSDYGKDTDSDGLYDYLTIDVGVNVTTAEDYSINGGLYDGNGNDIAWAINSTYIDIGNQTVQLNFDGKTIHKHGLNGPYYLKHLVICDKNRKPIESVFDAYTTNAYTYTDFEAPLAVFTGDYADYGIDTDGDGLYDYLTIDVGVNVITPGDYGLTGYLYDINGSEIVWSIDYYGSLDVGNHTMHLDFNGKTIQMHGVSGPYYLKHLKLSGENWTFIDYIPDAYNTSAYNYSGFVDPVSTENEVTISGVGLGEIRLIVSFTDTIPVFAGRYSYDLVGINVPQRPNNFTITTSEVKNLKVGVKKIQDNTTRLWVTQTIAAPEGIATVQSDLPSPGNYHVKIFGDAAEGVSRVDLELTAVKKIKASGDFSLSIDISGFPAGKYTVTATADTGCFTDLTLEGLPLTP